MNNTQTCPECGAVWAEGKTCQDDFHQLLFWETQYPEIGSVHHLMVLCYHLQHPGLYSPQGLAYGLQLLVDFLEAGLTPTQAARRSRPEVRSDRRDWKITASPGSQGAYPHPVDWSIRVGDVAAAGPQAYRANILAWARSVLADLRAAGNLPVRPAQAEEQQ